MAAIKKFFAAEKGGVLIIGALSMFTLLTISGVAIDTATGLLNQRKLQAAVDSTARAAAQAAKAGTNTSKMLNLATSTAKNVFPATISGLKGVTGPTVNLNAATKALTVSASIDVPTFFMKLANIKTVKYKASTMITITPPIEVAVAVDASVASAQGFLNAAANNLILFVKSLDTNALVSITPFATEIALNAVNTVPANLMGFLNTQGPDVSSSPAFYAISGNYPWNFASYSSVYNYFYGTSFPTKTSYYPLSGTCPAGHAACSTLFPGTCSSGSPSCSSLYDYNAATILPILPLTANRTLLQIYLQGLATYTGASNGLWPALIVWAWRTIAPEWNTFFLANGDPASITYETGTYPLAYGATAKFLVLLVSGDAYWKDAQNVGNDYFIAKCGISGAVRTALCKPGSKCFPNQTWKTTLYGIMPLTSDYSTMDDGTCDNYDYKTIDKSLGLNLSNKSYSSTVTAASYSTSVLNSLSTQFNTVCTNIKAQGITIFVVTKGSNANFTACASKTSYAYQTDGSYTQVGNALGAIVKKINQANDDDD